LQEDKRFFPAFKKSQLYIKLLAELDLLKETSSLKDDGIIIDEGNIIVIHVYMLFYWQLEHHFCLS